MDLTDPVTQQYGFAAFALVFGLGGCLAPYRWNPLRLKGAYARNLTEQKNMLFARAFGALLLVMGISIGIITYFNGAIE